MRLWKIIASCVLSVGCAAGLRGAVVITEIMYNPSGPDGVTSPNPTGEWVEICNTGVVPVDISGWRLDDEDATDFSSVPAGSSLAPGETAVLCTHPSEFARAWGSNIKTFRVLWGILANSASSTNEVLVLLDRNGVEVDRANYETGTGGWPASSNGASIQLQDVSVDNNLGSNWALSLVGRDGARRPAAGASPYEAADVASPGVVPNLVPLSPAHGEQATAASGSLDLRAFASGTQDVTVRWYARSFIAPPATPFRIVVLPDSQYYSQSYPSTFAVQTRWIVDHQDEMSIVAVLHVGDIVNRAYEPTQWANANAAMSILDGNPTLPIGLCVGNHDQNPREDPDGTAEFNQWFPFTRYQDRPWYGGHYGTDNDNSYIIFTAGGMKFISIQLEYALTPNPAVLDWAANLMRMHADRRAILVSHSLIDNNTTGLWTLPGTAIFNALHGEPNLGLMLCGHVPGESRRTDYVADRRIHTLLADYQDRDAGGSGWLRILEFVPADNVIHVRTYSPTLDRYETDGDSEFSLWCPMGGTSFVQIGETSMPAGGTELKRTWSGTAPGRICQWYATAATAQHFVRTPIQDFLTRTARMDLDRDGDVDQADLEVFVNCLTGPDVAYRLPEFPDTCTLTTDSDAKLAIDRDRDGDVDQVDFGALQRCLGDPNCIE